MKKLEFMPISTKRVFRALKIDTEGRFYKALRKLYWRVATDKVLPFRSYSTYGEDAVLRVYLPERSGSYLDIGSGEPKNGSNTYFLYRRGWRGILVDPLSRNQKLSKKQRPRDQFIRGVVSDSTTSLDFYEYSEYQYSHSNPTLARELAKKGILPIRSEMFVPIQVSSLELEIKPADPFLLAIDVESHESSVLSTVNWSVFQPRVICVEEWSFDPGKNSEIGVYLHNQSYVLMSRAVTSNIYVHSSYLSAFLNATQYHQV